LEIRIGINCLTCGGLLGTIAWYGAWRQFCLYPALGTVFNNGCLNDIQAKIAELKAEWQEQWREEQFPWREEQFE
jgi:hypothetical protein